MSARAAAQLEFLDYTDVYRYPAGKADWIVRGLPSEPPAPSAERLRALPYFLNNLAPGFRDGWIRLSGRAGVIDSARDDLPRLAPGDPFEPRLRDALEAGPLAVVLVDGVLLGAVETAPRFGTITLDALNPAPQTIRPDMTHHLAARLLRNKPYLLVTDARGVYLGRYAQAPAR